jgi:hypothetical protein
MKKISIISASLLMGSLAISSCSSNKMAASSVNDNLYFMASDVKIATQYAVANNNPSTFQNLAKEPAAAQENFSSRNVNPEYLSRYGQISATEGDEVVYFDDNQAQTTGTNQPNIDVYNSFSVNNFNTNRGWGNTAFNMGMGMGFGAFNPWGMGFGGFSPWGMGFNDPFLNPFWGFRPGFNVGLNFGFGRPFFDPFNPFFGFGGGFGGFGGFYDPFWGNGIMGSPWGWGRPIYATGPIIVLPGSEFGNRRVVYGSRPTRGASMTTGGRGMGQSAIVPSTARAQARANAANATATSPRRLVSSENARGASRDFSSSQNDYYNSGRSRVANTGGTTRNMNSAASDRSSVSGSRSSVPSARPSSAYPTNSRSYGTTPSRSSSYPSGYDRNSNPSYNRSESPSYNRSTVPGNNSRSTSPSYNRSTSPSYNSSGSPSRSTYNNNSSSFSSPSRSSSSGSSSGSSYSAPSRSTGGSSGGSSGGSYSGGSRGGRGN